MINTALESYGLKTSTGFDHGRVRLPSLPWRHKNSQPMACIDSRTLSTTAAASPSLPELLVGETHANSPAH